MPETGDEIKSYVSNDMVCYFINGLFDDEKEPKRVGEDRKYVLAEASQKDTERLQALQGLKDSVKKALNSDLSTSDNATVLEAPNIHKNNAAETINHSRTSCEQAVDRSKQRESNVISCVRSMAIQFFQNLGATIESRFRLNTTRRP